MGNNNSVKRIAAALGGVFFVFLCASCIILIQVCARVSKNQEMEENLLFGALPLALGVPNFPKVV